MFELCSMFALGSMCPQSSYAATPAGTKNGMLLTENTQVKPIQIFTAQETCGVTEPNLHVETPGLWVASEKTCSNSP